VIRLLAPGWLLLVLPLWLLYRGRRATVRTLERRLRLAAVGCLLLVLARPVIRLPAREGIVIAIADRSASMPAGAGRSQQDWIMRLERAMPPRSKLGVIAFAERIAIEQAPQGAGFGGFVGHLDGHATALAGAVETAISLVPAGSAARLLVMSDGLHTGLDPMDPVVTAIARGIPIDFRHQARSAVADTAIIDFEVPASPRPHERIVLTAWIQSPHPGRVVPYRLERDNRLIASGEQPMPGGRARLQFVDTAPASGVMRYTLSIPPAPDDPIPENNVAHALARVEADTLPMLCLTPGDDSGLVSLLQRSGVSVRAMRPHQFDGSLTTLAGYSSVLIENSPAAAIGRSALTGLAAWVRELGGGLMTTGGRQAYGTGGYFQSPLDPVLPVSMELRREHRKFSVAVMLVLDRSGSMSMPAATAGRSKMDLANLGCVEVLDLLSDADALGVLAVDTATHTIVPLMPVGQARARRGDILGIRSQGGGIYVYTGLRAAAAMLAGSDAGARHIILFADAADAEEPGGYVALLEQCRAAGITCSVVGLGSPNDRDADFLRDVAARGGGDIYFTDQAEEIPRIFAQDTLAVTRQAFIEEATPVVPAPGWAMLAREPLDGPPPVGGYNLTYLRPGATLAARLGDEDQAPLLAFWHVGAGRALAFTAEADGADAGAFADWTEAGAFYATGARWAAGEGEAASGFVVRSRLTDGVWTVDLHTDPDHPALLGAAPELAILRAHPGQSPEPETVLFRWTGPYRLTARVPLQGEETVLSAVRMADRASLSLPPVRLPVNPEYAPRDPAEGITRLQRMARATGGMERMEPTAIWSALNTTRPPRGIAPFFMLLAALFLLAAIFERRTGWLSAWRKPRAPIQDHIPTDHDGGDRLRAPVTAWPDQPPPPEQDTAAPKADRPFDPLREAAQRARQRLSR